MDFVRRRLSQGGSSDDEGKSLSSSFSEGTSRFFSSMVAKKNGLLNNISSKIENVMKASSSEDSSSGADTPDDSRASPSNGHHRSGGDRDAIIDKTQEYRHRKKTTERIGRPQYASSSSYSDSSGSDDRGITPTTIGNISFDEPLYSPSSQKHSNFEKNSAEIENRMQETYDGSEPIANGNHNRQNQIATETPSATEVRGENDHTQTNDSPSIDENVTDKSDDQGDKDENSDEKPVVRRAPKLTSTNRRSSTVDEMLFDDYVPPETENDETQDTVSQDINFNNNRKKTLIPMGDLMSFDDDNEADIKMSSTMKKADPSASKTSPFQSISSIDSSEYSAYNLQTSVDSSDSEFGGFQLQRTCSFGSENSWSSSYSVDSQPDDITLECMEFMKQFVDKVFDASYIISQTEKAKFGELCQEMPGRQWFSRYVNSQRVHNKRVSEQIFFRLVQYFAVVLFECNEAEDYTPAKSLMNMCFTFYHQNCHGKNFLYSYLREQPIWQSLRFWNAAFFDAVQSERSKRPMSTRNDKNETQTDDQRFQENITFGQLGTFTCNMRAFGLSKELCLEFLRKQSIIANLKKEQVQMLKDNVDKWKDQ